MHLSIHTIILNHSFVFEQCRSFIIWCIRQNYFRKDYIDKIFQLATNILLQPVNGNTDDQVFPCRVWKDKIKSMVCAYALVGQELHVPSKYM